MSAHGLPVVTPLRGTPPAPGAFGGRAGAAPVARERRVRTPPPDDPLLPPLAGRGVAFAAFAAFGALHWMLMLEPATPARAWRALGVALVAAALLAAAARLPGPGRWIAAATTAAGGFAFALMAGGVPAERLRPSEWSGLAAAIGRGVDGLPGVRIPYRGLDPDLALVIPLGGTALVMVAALLAFWPRRGRSGFPAAALIALVTLYAVPAVALILTAEFLRGAALVVLVLAFLRLERLRGRDAPAAAAVAAGAAVVALALAPALDDDNPWWDYENWTQSAAGSRSTTFSWDHEYGPLDWPRDGRELLRISSRNRAYWKADDLDVFDGRRWVRDLHAESLAASAAPTAGVDAERLRRWSFRINVVVRSLRSQTLPIAGTAIGVNWPRHVTFQIRPGIYEGPRPIHRGDAYSARVYVPQPSDRELREAGSAYVGYGMDRYLGVAVQLGDERRVGTLRSARFAEVAPGGFGQIPRLVNAEEQTGRPAADVLAGSDLRRTYNLARRLLRGTSTPYEYLRAVERHLGDGYAYTETPPDAARSLDGFLFDAREGYCQQFSGAMALLLRLGGVPARVATGFSPGAYDRRARQYVARDVDAHSWVEAWFPGIGWVAFDPTPASAPPRSQASAFAAANAGVGDIRDRGTTLVNTIAPPDLPADRNLPWGLIVLAAAALAAAAFAARALVRVRRRGPLPPTVELERALRIAGGGLPPGLTLAALEQRFAASPHAAGYVRALRAERYAPGGGGPTAAQRRGLRRALARGGGALGGLRALRALPPRPRLPRHGRPSA